MPSLSLVITAGEDEPDAGNAEPRHRGAWLTILTEGQPSNHKRSVQASNGVWSWELKDQGPVVTEE